MNSVRTDNPRFIICLSFKIEDVFGRCYWNVGIDTLAAAQSL